jgi:hypothetical protein
MSEKNTQNYKYTKKIFKYRVYSTRYLSVIIKNNLNQLIAQILFSSKDFSIQEAYH